MGRNINYKRILMTHDASKCASAIIPYVVSLAKVYDSEILLLQIIDSAKQEASGIAIPNISMYPPISPLGEELLKLTKVIKEKAKNNLNKIRKEFEDQGVMKIKMDVREGFAQEAILYVAKKEKVDLIAMSTHGRTGLGGVLLGSVAKHIIQHAECPVLTVRPSTIGGEKI